MSTAESLCNEIVQHVPGCQSSAVLRSVMTSLGLMRYSHPALVDSIITWYQSSSMDTRDMTTLIITLASINYSGVSAQALLDSVTGQLQSSSLPDHVWLDTVWSLTVLGRVTHQQVQSVLESSFSNNILCKYHLLIFSQ